MRKLMKTVLVIIAVVSLGAGRVSAAYMTEQSFAAIFGEKGGSGLLTREKAAEIICRSQGISTLGGNLSLYCDGLLVTPSAAGSVAAAIRLGIMDASKGIRPRALIKEEEAMDMLRRAQDLKPEFLIQSERDALLCSKLSFILGAMWDLDRYTLQGEPDNMLASRAVYSAALQLEEDVYRDRDCVMLTQEQLQQVYTELFAIGKLKYLDPAVSGEQIDVQGDMVKLWGETRRPEVELSSRVGDTVCVNCTFGREYAFTAKVELKDENITAIYIAVG